MRSVSRGLAALGVLLVAGGGYLTADVYDLVPGVFTLDRAPSHSGTPILPAVTQTASPSGTVTGVPIPSVAGSVAAPLLTVADAAPIPTKAGLAAALARALTDAGLGSSVGLTVRDAHTGAHLLDVSAQVPRTPASTVKLLTATAIVTTLDPALTFSTRAVRGASAGHVTDVILVAGGDTLLSPGKGNPLAVAGRAGLVDLAGQTSQALKTQGITSVRLRIDERYASGPRYAPGWLHADISQGLTGPVAMLGLSTQQPRPGTSAFTDPALSTAQAFRTALASQGLVMAPGIDWAASPKGARELGVVRSAPLSDVLALALTNSDNPLTESLARQAATKAGRPTSFTEVAAWVKEKAAAKGVHIEGVTLIDTSGLSGGTLITARSLGDVLALAAGGKEPALQQIVAQLPVAGLSGTLTDRFLSGSAHSAAGVVRAKTGTLTGASALAGTVVDRDGRLLVFAILADRIPAGVGTLTARAALDRFVATLASCGCG
ncbi:MAG TPA: D-alanyl-D-alanine carboxypeptidase/D-alanyl-D-alanine-endopeptidase [Dermatophilaceae bacterium]